MPFHGRGLGCVFHCYEVVCVIFVRRTNAQCSSQLSARDTARMHLSWVQNTLLGLPLVDLDLSSPKYVRFTYS